MNNADNFDKLFQQAVSAIDAGDEGSLDRLLSNHPELATERLYSPGQWLTSVIGNALKSFFSDPYLLWFVSEDAVRTGKLPKNIATIASTIIKKAKSQNAVNLQEQLDYTLRLVAWSTVARDCGVQIELIDVLINSGAHINSVSNDALVNGNIDAARHLVKRGGKLTLPTALCLEQWDDADALSVNATDDEKQFSLVLAALIGKAAAVSKTISYGVDVNKPSDHLFSHGTPLHHAVWSGSLDTVKVLINAGANLNAKDTAWNGTPLGWAEYGNRKEIATYLKEIGPNKQATPN